MFRSIKKIAAAAAFVMPLAAATPASADVIQLGFILDGSGSISGSEWNTIRGGLASAINLIPFGGADTYEVSVVQFSTNASSYASASRILITDATVRSNLSTFIGGLAQLGGSTNYQAAFTTMQSVLSPTLGGAAFSYVNFATDGEPNTCTSGTNPSCAITAFANLTGAGVDNVSVEGIGVSASAALNLQTNFCYPGPCDTTNPYNFPTQGFYIGVADAAGYAAAIGNKIRVITNQVPEPTSLALLAAGLLGFGFSRRRAA